MNRIAGRAWITILLVLLLAGGMGFFVVEYVSNADDWVIFPGSPHVYNGGNIGCGVVTDRSGVLLLDMKDNQRVYAENKLLRSSVLHWIGDRNGSVDAPALSYYAAQMSGFDLISGVYSYGKNGGVAKLTLSAKIQTAALEALGCYKGTVGVYNYKTGELICAVTSPTYDPDEVPDLSQDESGMYEGMYLNRFIQSAYTPGSIFKIITLAAALEEDPGILDQSFVCTGSYWVGDDEIICEGAHWEQNLKEAFCNSCNCAFAQIALQLGKEKLSAYAEQFGITNSVSFDGITTAKGNYDIDNAADIHFAWSSIGQYTDQINPCRFMTFMGAIAGGGRGKLPYLVESIAVDGNKTYTSRQTKEERIMSTQTAEILKEYLQNNVDIKYGSENFPGLTVCAKTGTAEVGGDKKPNAMLAGFVSDEKYPAFAIFASILSAHSIRFS